MRIVAIRDQTVKLAGNIANAVVSFADHTVSLVALISDQRRNGQPVVGYGFNSIGRFAQSSILRERMMPRLMTAPKDSLINTTTGNFDAQLITLCAMQNEKPGGHGDRAGALAALELAVWDLNAKLADEPAYQTIAKHFGYNMGEACCPVYAAGGYYYAQDSQQRLRRELAAYRDSGFNAFKIKIGGVSIPEDVARIETALEIAQHGANLAVDANGRFEHAAAHAYGDAIRDMGLRWYEEPGDPLDFSLHKSLAKHYPGPLATGENLFSLMEAKNLATLGGMRADKDIFQFDPGLSYGLTEYSKILAMLEESGFDRSQCYPHGGHLINLHIAVGLGLGGCEAYPGVFQPFGGYPTQCRIENGRVWPSDAPGFGLEQKAELRPHLEDLVNI